VQEWCRIDSEAEFWRVFSNPDGSQMKLVLILKKLKAKREHQADIDAAAAREKYGDDLHHHPRFSYIKSGQTRWFSKSNEIVRVFREIEGLPQVYIFHSFHFAAAHC
jgi:hypothetical protein